MNRFGIHVFRQEFESLLWILPVEWKEDMETRVSRISHEFMEKRALHDGATGNLVDIADDAKIFLLSASGKLLAEVRQTIDITHNEANWDNEYEDGETVGEALLRLGQPDRVAYAVEIREGYIVKDHHSVGGYSVTLYKPPKGFTLSGWLNGQIRREKEKLSAALAEIDAEATAK